MIRENQLQAWFLPFTLAQFIAQRSEKVFGVAGPPGVGKTTLVSVIKEALSGFCPEATIARASLDDFYWPLEERRRRGFRWRGPPGTHNLEAAKRLLALVRRGAKQIELPRFDHARDDQGTTEIIEGPVSRLLFEGWFLGMQDQGYEELRSLLDYLIYLDCPLALARDRRLQREKEARRDGTGGGMTQSGVELFWREVLEPGVEKWVQPIRSEADLLIELDDRGEVMGASRQRS